MTLINSQGRKVWVDRSTGREVAAASATDEQYQGSPRFVERVNGPHHNAKWARHLRGVVTVADVRRERSEGGSSKARSQGSTVATTIKPTVVESYEVSG